MTTELVTLLGDTLLSGSEAIKTADALKGKASILLYFSAHWCPPCRGFTPVLGESYKEYKASGGNEAEVVFVSRDRDLTAFKDYFVEMPWLALPFENNQDLLQGLGKKFDVKGIPCLVALGPDGKQLFEGDSVDPRSLVAQHKGAAFPMTLAHVKQLKAELENKAKQSLKEFRSIFPPLCTKTGEEKSFGELLDSHDHLVLVLGDGDASDRTYQTLTKVETGVSSLPGGSKRLAVIYLGWSLYNESCNHADFKDKFYTARESASDLTEDFKKALGLLCGGEVSAPHALVLACDENGVPTIVTSAPGCQTICKTGSEGYPWSKERMAELEVAKEARISDLKKKQTNLQFLKGPGREGLCSNSGIEVKVDSLAAGESDAVVGLYFSAHWCQPCRGFTPVLAQCHKDLQAAGKTFEVVFLSSDKDEEAFKEYFAEMPWLAVPFEERSLKEDLSNLFEVQGIPTLVLLKPDGTVLAKNGREAISLGAEYFPWGPDEMACGTAVAEQKAAEKLKAAIKAEATAVEEQTAKGVPVVKRLRGKPGVSFEHDVATKTVMLKSFPTLGAPELLVKSGTLYYEIEILESEGIPQCGFAGIGFDTSDDYSGDGVGDDTKSWGFDGVRGARWNGGSAEWPCSWKTGDIIGFAANIDLGKIAISKNGSWTDSPNGLVFKNPQIKEGVYPAFTGSGYNLRYNLDGDKHGPFAHAPPPSHVW
eukprot:CAMPEP_0197654422 /NCGR_PEP_ID=MMETSP1338-20131121/38838_1 /TAXON_ID=43686 ORGANISM="Pelagodinium beii, Strain RCC1491" /NCGR_SAMPLE_ID=MMETSP1338 /ASSEMBLY_ACC=CAM_ASM_000754 /LENGTH=706 /DNA_ID=CAMNT_0043229865 /DNA_START=72 /DNA_END=2189 /DNA_ORIENTATION=-